MQGFSYLLLSSEDASSVAGWMWNLKLIVPVFSSTTVWVFLLPFIMAPKLMGEAGSILNLLYAALADTLTGMLATVWPPSPAMASITCVHRKGW